MELCIDTSTRFASAALSLNGEVAMELAWRSDQNHSVEYVPALRSLMERAGVRMAQVDAVFVARGPGGFSALRVGISLAKALAMARDIPLVAVGTLDVEAQPYLGLGLPVCAVIEAGRGIVYAALYGSRLQTGGHWDAVYRVVTYDGLVSSVREPTVFCGEGVGAVADVLRENLGETAMVVDVPPPTRRPGALARLGYLRWQASDTDDPETLAPLYMRGSQFDVAQRRLKEA